MPETAAFIDALRDAFPDAEINEAIKAGMAGEPRFWACENGREVGTPIVGGENLHVINQADLAEYAADIRRRQRGE